MKFLKIICILLFTIILLTSCTKQLDIPTKPLYSITKIIKIGENYRLYLDYFGKTMILDVTSYGSCIKNGILQNSIVSTNKIVYYINPGWSCTLMAIYHYENETIIKKIYDNKILKVEGNIIKKLIKEATNNPQKYIN